MKGNVLYLCLFQLLPHIELYVHDEREKFMNLGLFPAVRVALFNNTITNLVIRAEFIQQQSKKVDPCVFDEGYSYMRVSRVRHSSCGWDFFLLTSNGYI